MTTPRRPRVLAISSGGGHWIELKRLQRAFEGCEVVWCTTHADYRDDLPAIGQEGTRREFHVVVEANRWKKWLMIRQVFGVAWVVLRARPDAVVSTGASPGVFGLFFGKLFFRAHTIWVQSIADTENMSMSGKLVRRHADLWLTQWEHLARPEGPHYHGAVV